MRLSDTCQLRRSGVNVGGPRPCSFGHTSGATPTLSGHIRFHEFARIIVGPDPELADSQTVAGWEAVYRGKTYRVTAILPRYRTQGRLHHVSLDVEVLSS